MPTYADPYEVSIASSESLEFFFKHVLGPSITPLGFIPFSKEKTKGKPVLPNQRVIPAGIQLKNFRGLDDDYKAKIDLATI